MMGNITYFLNWMGPISSGWYEDNKIPYKEVTKENRLLGKTITIKEYKTHYSCGRVDVHGSDDPWMEFSVPVMESSSWNKISDWLYDFSSESVLTKDELFSTYERETGEKIKWWNVDNDKTKDYI